MDTLLLRAARALEVAEARPKGFYTSMVELGNLSTRGLATKLVFDAKVEVSWSPSQSECFATTSLIWPKEFPNGLHCITRHAPTAEEAVLICYAEAWSEQS